MLTQMLLAQTPGEHTPGNNAYYVPVSIHDTRETTLIVGPNAVHGTWSGFTVNQEAVIEKVFIAALCGPRDYTERVDLTGKTLAATMEYVPPSNYEISYIALTSGSVLARGF